MTDPKAPLRVLEELLWTLRRSGFVIAPSQAIDAARAAAVVGFSDRGTLRAALAAVVVSRPNERAKFDAAFDRFFGGEPPKNLWERLGAGGFSEMEIDAVRAWLAAHASRGEGAVERFGALLEGGAEIDRLLALGGVTRALANLASPMQVGFFTQRVATAIALPLARARLSALRVHLVDALGARGDTLADALAAELDRAGTHVREFVQERAALAERLDDGKRRALVRGAAPLDPSEIDAVRRAVRDLAARLGGAERTRRRRAARGRIDPHRTLRRLLRTGGVPFAPARRRRRRDRPKLVLLCDVSDSVRAIATFLLEFVYSAHELFAHTRSFVFVSDVGESTQLFERERPEQAIQAAFGGSVVAVTDNSNYGRAFRRFLELHGDALDRRTTVVVLGDGRSNFHDPGEDALAEVRRRARHVLWLCPEPRPQWASGDSAMLRYETLVSEVMCVRSVEDLERAARRLVSVRR